MMQTKQHYFECNFYSKPLEQHFSIPISKKKKKRERVEKKKRYALTLKF